MTKLIILNGPPGCGKDTLANHYEKVMINIQHIKFAESLKVMTHRLYNVPNPEYYEQFQQCKDEPNYKYFYGLTPRQAYIAVSEQYVKKVHTPDFFGVKLVEKINTVQQTYGIETFVSSDGGLEEELLPVVKECGGRNILVVKILREGCGFDNDSRSYYSDDFLSKLEIESTQLINDNLNDFLNSGILTLKEFL